MDELREVRRLGVLRRLRCGKDSCQAELGLGFSQLNIRRLTKPGIEPTVFQVCCPMVWEEACDYGSLVVFVSPVAEDPESLAMDAALEHLDGRCAECGRKLGWEEAEAKYRLDRSGEPEDEIELRITCPLSLRDRLRQMFGRRVVRHGHLRYIRWAEDDEDDEVPDRLPSDWLISPHPVPA